MDIESLRSFLAFSETGSFTRAAKQINRTQSAFSAQMKKLESEVGAPLFEKEGRNVVLTEAGITLRADAKQILELHDSSLNKIKRYQNKRSLRLGCLKITMNHCYRRSSVRSVSMNLCVPSKSSANQVWC
ncbi:transcriptional regulator [Vibrio maritimus]|uniref:Transcriptional regulator n=1 Tax=Vibrio maritimus TaxID=990268 RepID=A0A090SSK0_9VIBR|nr:transcriptional regulator [Vibrio maritimus]